MNRSGHAAILLIACCTWSTVTRGTETDDFTTRNAVLRDAAPALNAQTNRLIDAAIAELNRESTAWHNNADRTTQDRCSETDLYEAIADSLGGAIVGRLETYAMNADGVDRKLVERKDSIYRNFSVLETPSLGGDTGRLAPTVQVGARRFGADKLGHFVDQGYTYFRLAYLEGAGVEAALRYGDFTERTYYGALLTGVYSYADLAANFQGMRFFANLTGRYADPITGERGNTPLVRCVHGEWLRVRQFDWRNYADAAWNEATNCSRFRNPELARRVEQQLRTLEADAVSPGVCASGLDAHPDLRARYGPWLAHVVNSAGHDSIEPPLVDPLLRTVRHALDGSVH